MVDFDSLRAFETKRWFMCSMWLWKVGFVSGGARFWLVSTSPYQRHSMAESTPWGGREPVHPLELLRDPGGVWPPSPCQPWRLAQHSGCGSLRVLWVDDCGLALAGITGTLGSSSRDIRPHILALCGPHRGS